MMIFSRSLLLRTFAFRVITRGIISDSYANNKLWTARLNSPAFNNLSASDLGIQIMHRLSNNAPVTPLDYDIFVNKVQLSESTFLDFLEKIITKFQVTQNALSVLPSTSHAVVQAYLNHNEEYRLVDLMKRRSETGIFLDEVSANLLLAQLTKKKDYTTALSVLWELCLQSHFEENGLQPYTLALSLLTISSALQFEDNFLKPERDILEENDEEDDIDFLRVPYLRNPNYDTWFDIKRPRLQLGHCFLSLADAINDKSIENLSTLHSNYLHRLKLLSPSMYLLGLALSENIPDLLIMTEKAVNSPTEFPIIDKAMVEVMEKLVDASDRRPDDSEQKRGEPVLLTEKEISVALDKFKELSSKLELNKSVTFSTEVNALLSSLTTDADIRELEEKRVQMLYAQFTETRENVWKQELDKMKRRKILSEVKAGLRQLTDEEERLTFFEHAAEIEHEAWLAPRTQKERSWSRMKEWRRELEQHQAKKQGSRETLSEA